MVSASGDVVAATDTPLSRGVTLSTLSVRLSVCPSVRASCNSFDSDSIFSGFASSLSVSEGKVTVKGLALFFRGRIGLFRDLAFFFASLSLSLSLSLFPVISEPAVVAGRGQWSRANNNNMWKLRAATATAGDRSRAGRHRFHRSSCFFFSTGGWRTNAEMKEPTPRRLFPRWILMRSAGLEGEEATASPAPTTQKKLKVNNKGISWNVSQRCGSEKVAGPPSLSGEGISSPGHVESRRYERESTWRFLPRFPVTPHRKGRKNAVDLEDCPSDYWKSVVILRTRSIRRLHPSKRVRLSGGGNGGSAGLECTSKTLRFTAVGTVREKANPGGYWFYSFFLFRWNFPAPLTVEVSLSVKSDEWISWKF